MEVPTAIKTIKDAAEYVGCNRRTIYRWQKAGKLRKDEGRFNGQQLNKLKKAYLFGRDLELKGLRHSVRRLSATVEMLNEALETLQNLLVS